MWHAPLSARQLARCAQIRDVQLLRDVIRIGDQLVLIVIATVVRGVLLFLVLGGLFLLELSAIRACRGCELGFPCGLSSLIFFIFLLIFLIFVFVRIIFIVVFLVATTRARKD